MLKKGKKAYGLTNFEECFDHCEQTLSTGMKHFNKVETWLYRDRSLVIEAIATKYLIT